MTTKIKVHLADICETKEIDLDTVDNSGAFKIALLPPFNIDEVMRAPDIAEVTYQTKTYRIESQLNDIYIAQPAEAYGFKE